MSDCRKNPKVIVAGHSCIDITPIFPDNNQNSTPGEILFPGKLLSMDGVTVSPGGAVSNTGIALKKLGAEVSLLTKMGRDEFGAMLKGVYDSYGVGNGVLLMEGERTSYSVVLAIPGSDRIFLHDSGCNNTFCCDDIKDSDYENVRLFHFGYPPLMKRMYENEGEELLKVFSFIKEKGIITSLDMAAVDPSSEAGQVDWDKVLRKVLPKVDIFVPSVEELCFMLDRRRYNELCEAAKGDDVVNYVTRADLDRLSDMCMEYGVKILLIKCGAPGFYYRTQTEDVLSEINYNGYFDEKDWADKVGFENSYAANKVLSATGAGDTTIAAFLAAFLTGEKCEMSMHIAAAEGASCVEDYSAYGGIKTIPQLKDRMNAGWQKGSGLKC